MTNGAEGMQKRWASNVRSIQSTDRVFGVAAVLKLDKGESRWIASNPDVFQRAEL